MIDYHANKNRDSRNILQSGVKLTIKWLVAAVQYKILHICGILLKLYAYIKISAKNIPKMLVLLYMDGEIYRQFLFSSSCFLKA